jgi:hypothetical protein
MDIYYRTICFMYALQYGYSRYLVNSGTPANRPYSVYTGTVCAPVSV